MASAHAADATGSGGTGSAGAGYRRRIVDHPYSVQIKRSATRDLAQIARQDRERIGAAAVPMPRIPDPDTKHPEGLRRGREL